MERIRIIRRPATLVDQVESKLLDYFTEHNMKLGESLPSEMELSESLGVTRSVVREALSRLKMLGIVESRTRRGMILTEPTIFGGMKRAICPNIMSDESLLNLLGFRIALEIGITPYIFSNITPEDISDLEKAVNMEVALGDNIYANISEHKFHAKLYEITRNSTIIQFQEIIYPVMEFVKSKLKEYVTIINADLENRGELVSHVNLLEFLKKKDQSGYREAIEKHFYVYRELIRSNKLWQTNANNS